METTHPTIEELRALEGTPELKKAVLDFLNGEGNNPELAAGLADKELSGPVELKLTSLKKIAGPYKEIKYFEPKQRWEIRVAGIIKLLQEGKELFPLIVRDNGEKKFISDGNHRQEAMKRFGMKSHWCILYKDDEEVVHENPSSFD